MTDYIIVWILMELLCMQTDSIIHTQRSLIYQFTGGAYMATVQLYTCMV